jgi:uncharacterized LabA/DUF88 family protein
MKRVIVFIDGQNFYRSALRAFFDGRAESNSAGQFHPEMLGKLLASRDADRILTEVRVYTGRPDAYLQAKAHAANVRQCQAWEKAACYVFTRPLRYPPGFSARGDLRPEEKGIDVAIALDFARLAERGAYDVGILCSGDTDLIPAVEVVLDGAGATAEVAGWRTDTYRQRLSIPGRNVWCHWLARADYEEVRDSRDYTSPE